jgi:predicted GNAT superfamily acetyltransferase
LIEPYEIRIAPLTTIDEFDRCVALQDIVWGYDISGMMTQKVFLLGSQIGGQVLGAWAGDALAGYALSLPGVRNGHAYLHSHHLAVLPEFRNRAIGRRLKLAQRDDALRRGFDLIEWTFDPLEIKNAHLNVARLGAVIRSYRPNFYGDSSSPLQGGLPTDRVFAEWWLRSDRVHRILAGEPAQMQITAHVEVPAEIAAWKADADTRAKALDAQTRNRIALESAFASGLTVLGYDRNPHGDGQFLLGHWDEDFRY